VTAGERALGAPPEIMSLAQGRGLGLPAPLDSPINQLREGNWDELACSTQAVRTGKANDPLLTTYGPPIRPPASPARGDRRIPLRSSSTAFSEDGIPDFQGPGHIRRLGVNGLTIPGLWFLSASSGLFAPGRFARDRPLDPSF